MIQLYEQKMTPSVFKEAFNRLSEKNSSSAQVDILDITKQPHSVNKLLKSTAE